MDWNNERDRIPYCRPIYGIRDRLSHLLWAFIAGIITGTGSGLAPWAWSQLSTWFSGVVGLR
jgi:hypothetical protein